MKHFIDSFISKILIVCPHCKMDAVVRKEPTHAVATCTYCGYHESTTNGLLLGMPVDCYFYHDLWLLAQVGKELLWAYNLEHLKFLENFIAHSIRTDSSDQLEMTHSNRSLESQLPLWMLSAKNHDKILHAINILMKKHECLAEAKQSQSGSNENQKLVMESENT